MSAPRCAGPRACALLLLLTVLAGGCSKTVPELLNDAKQYRAAEDYNAAIIQLSNVFRQDPANSEAHELMGATYADTGALPDAELELRIALRLGASPERVLPILGRVLLDMEKYKEVLKEVAPVTQNAAPQALAQVALLQGRAKLALGMQKEAKTQFLLAASERPVEAKLGLAQVAAAQGDLASAQALTEEVLAASPSSAEAWLMKGNLLRVNLKNSEALVAYAAALRAKPNFVLALLSRASLNVAAGKLDSARTDVEKALKLAPASPPVQFTLALLSLREGNYDNSREALMKVFQVIPEHAPGTLLNGALMLATGELEQAQDFLVAYLTRFPGDVYARKLLGTTLIRKAQPRSAAFVLESLLDQYPQDGELRELAGIANLQGGDIDKARRYLEKAVSLDPANAEFRTRLGLARMAAGEQQGGVADIEAAVALNAVDSRADELLISVLITQKEAARAMEAVRVLEKKRPDKASTLQLKGAAYLAANDTANARASFERALVLDPAYFPAAGSLAEMDLTENKVDAARARLQRILEKDKHNLDALLSLANLESLGNKRGEAIAWLDRAVAEHPKAAQAYLMLAKTHLQQGQVDKAIGAAQKARSLNPNDTRVLETLGQAQLAKGDSRAAIVSFTNFVDKSPKSVPALLQLASAYNASGDHRLAITAAQRALEIAPDNLDAAVTLGIIYLHTRRLSEARGVAQQIQRRHPKLMQGFVLEGDVLMAKEEYAAAAAAYGKADAIENNGLIRVKLHQAQTLSGAGRGDDSALVAWLNAHPDDLETGLYLANHYQSDGRYNKAIERYEYFLRRDPKNVRVLNNLAWALEQNGDPRGLEYAQQAYQLQPNNAAVADTRGWLLVKRGQLDEGLHTLFMAVSLAPDSPEIRYHLAQALIQAGDTRRARSELETVLRSNRKFQQMPEARALLGGLAR